MAKAIKTIDPATYEPIYTCTHCHIPVIPNEPGVYTKEHYHFCSPACVYMYYEGEPAAEDEDYLP
jgi:hypothetical protein